MLSVDQDTITVNDTIASSTGGEAGRYSGCNIPLDLLQLAPSSPTRIGVSRNHRHRRQARQLSLSLCWRGLSRPLKRPTNYAPYRQDPRDA